MPTSLMHSRFKFSCRFSPCSCPPWMWILYTFLVYIIVYYRQWESLGIPCQTLGASPFFLLPVQSVKFHVMHVFIQCRNGKVCNHLAILFPVLKLYKILHIIFRKDGEKSLFSLSLMLFLDGPVLVPSLFRPFPLSVFLTALSVLVGIL